MSAFSRVLGSFLILRRRVRDVQCQGLEVWTDCGQRAALEVQTAVRAGAHRAEVGALGIESELRDVLADGKVTPAEFHRLKGLTPRAHRVAEHCHDVGEVVS